MSMDDVIEMYKRDIDRSMLIENLRLSPQERSEKFVRAMRVVFELRRAAAVSREAQPVDDPARNVE